MTRRQFMRSVTLVSVWAGVAGPFGLFKWGLSQEGERTVSEIQQNVNSLFGELDSARYLGKRYLGLYPHEEKRAVLLAERIRLAQPWTLDGIKTVLAGYRESDFQNGNIVIIDGWVLSRTEVETCALTILL